MLIEAGANFDLIVIGGGINGAGVARDAAGRGLSVLLVEKSDLSSATSSWSSKLIHGGLRYLEQYEFRLVAEALAERETLLNIAQHLVKPMRFVMPHVPALRPRWMIRAGLFLYDHLGHRAKKPAQPDSQLLGSHGIRLNGELYGAGLKSDFTHGFIYSDCRVDDSRLVLTNALSAAEHGAKIMTRTECVAGKRENNAWTLTLRQNNAATITVVAKALVNAAGPWVKTVLNDRLLQPSTDQVRLVKGSHIVVNRCYPGEHAYILQNHDRRVVFMIPYLEHYTLIGTTDVPVNSVADVPEEVMHQTGDLLAAAKAGVPFADKVVSLHDVVQGRSAAKQTGDNIVLFKSVGSALQDMAVSELCLEKARSSVRGTELPVGLTVKGRK
ncbi:MAG: glycerol-3-phosphate dehydrogenase [Betaproteobacteria bacterium]|nr:glycerol-3-phosphate dehydrogenase [Betaproteobacteria bacterium]